MNKLLIIESPNKIKTIAKYLDDKEFKIVATIGHIRDLPSNSMGFDEKTLEPRWTIPKKKKYEKESKEEIVAKIKKIASEADEIYLATDPDREGEAISWHVYDILNKSDQQKCKRITFNEITKPAILEALEHPRDLDDLWVKSQFARRILDRLVGYKISKIVRKKVHGKSAGRVQSVALKMIYDREKEIEKFKPTKWWTVDPIFDNRLPLILREINPNIQGLNYNKVNDDEGTGIDFKDEKSALLVKENLTDTYKVYAVDEPKTYNVRPKEPYKTSTLQQDAINRLGWNIRKVTTIAQNLYEGVNIDGESVALISYPRTDSVRISNVFTNKLKEYIIKTFGAKYYQEPNFKNKPNNANIQDAHEAIRVVDLNITPASIKNKISKDEFALYQLVWSRTLASHMANSIFENIIIRIINNKNKFYTYSRELKFDGFKKVYQEDDENKIRKLRISNNIIGEEFKINEVQVNEHVSLPPARFNQASLIKELDANGVGRPSTYRSMADMALERGYAKLEQRAYVMQELGNRVIEFLVKYFKFVVNVKFTSNVEKKLDDIAEGKEDWKKLIREYQPLIAENLKKASKDNEISNDDVGRKCPKCGHKLVYRYNHKTGAQFIGCSNYPKCKYLEGTSESNTIGKPKMLLDIKCPKCKHPLIVRCSKRHQAFIGCDNYPKCHYIMKVNKDELSKIIHDHLIPSEGEKK